jgi:hypothetical protein
MGLENSNLLLIPDIFILDCLHLAKERHYWIVREVIERSIRDIQVYFGQIGTDVKTLLKMSHNTLTRDEEYVK